ncbi:hypothetical protein F4805DRAFT_453370 [Annulohypoxylon moriforme]|nr:hypothetical protein F4805DRAFT_453370 [Annulohypoxylon moriforme]
MGSVTQEDIYVLPDAAAPSLILTHPTDDEKRRTWTLNHREWGGALTLEEYLEREPYLTTIPLTRNGGMTHWVLTDSSWSAEKGGSRPILASCESINKRVLVAAPGDTVVRDGVGHGVGSVFTYPEHRGNRYAGRMLNELGPALRKWQCEKQDNNQEAVCSALWSDIGKEYYAKKGWAAFQSLHVEFPVPANQTEGDVEKGKGKGKVTPITYTNLAQLCETDETLVREQVLRKTRETGRTCVAFAPDHDTMRWHLYRDDFIASILFKSSPGPASGAPSIKGALAGSEEGRRVWAVWSRNYYGGSGKPTDNVEKNTLYILRLVIEAEASEGANPSEDTVEAFTAVMRTALHEAATWNLGKVDLWNPSPLVKALIDRSGLQHRPVERDTDSIPSMMWYGAEKIEDIEWVANEKYCWC